MKSAYAISPCLKGEEELSIRIRGVSPTGKNCILIHFDLPHFIPWHYSLIYFYSEVLHVHSC